MKNYESRLKIFCIFACLKISKHEAFIFFKSHHAILFNH